MKTNSNHSFYFNAHWLRLFLLSSFSFFGLATVAQVNVLMNHNDLKRTGWNNREEILTQENVSGGNFGKIFSRTVDDQIYAQPLVLSNVSIGGGVHNIVIVATVNNTLYAFDADNPNDSIPYWTKNLTYKPSEYRPIKNTDMTGACTWSKGYKDFSGNMGIVGTPAIDSVTNTLYVVARSVTRQSPQTYVQYLHAINIKDGKERPNSPIYITGQFQGHWKTNADTVITFEQQKQNQRPGLLFHDGLVYISWASHCDWGPYFGWIMAYDATTLQQKQTYIAAPKGGLAGIWMSGQPPSVDDDGYMYVTTGNGYTGLNGNPNDTINRGSSIIKFKPGELKVADFFTPSNYQYLNDEDQDFGVDGVLLIPETHYSLSGSKEGRLYLIDNDNMGGATLDDSNVLQTLNVGDYDTDNQRHLHGSPVYYKDPNGNEYIYAWPEGALLKQFQFIRDSARFDTINRIAGQTTLYRGMPGGILSVSSNGSQAGTGIIWASHPGFGNAMLNTVPGVLQAFDATDVRHELWNSNWNSKRDSIGSFAKFVPPTIANGKVYMATFSNRLNVYGMNPPPASECASTINAPWQNADIGYTAFPGDVCVENNVYTITASGADTDVFRDAFHYFYTKVITNYTELTARIVSIKNTHANAKIGIMFRQTLDPGSEYVFLNFMPSDSITIKERNWHNNPSTTVGPAISQSGPYWIRMLNTGNKFMSFISPDGYDWTPVDTITLTMSTGSYVGMAYTTHNNNVLDTAVFDNFTLTLGGTLPVNLINFTAKNVNEKFASLKWTTTGEMSNHHFEIERSGLATDFVTVGSVNASGKSSSTNDYHFDDPSPLEGANFYRIKLVDLSGKTTYSSVVQVNFNFHKIEIFPNPASSKIFIRNNINFNNGENLRIELSEFSGKVLLKQNSSGDGKNIITVNIPSRIKNGMYLLMVTNSKGEKQGKKIFINR